eukprot:6181823-Karenia_brevis.AAC.1
MESSREKLRLGRAPGKDGIPTEIIKGLPCLLHVMQLLFTVMLTHAVYPTQWGIALVISLLKSGKTPKDMANYRGIRLISRFATWFGNLLDNRMRTLWRPSDEQFGFR